MTSFAFVLGNTPELSVAEIESVLTSLDYSFEEKRYHNDVLEIKFDKEINPKPLIEKLGGTVKISEYINEVEDIEKYDFLECFPPNIQKVDFGISGYGVVINSKKLSIDIKRNLAESGIKSRFVLPKEGPLSSVVVQKQKLTEIIILKIDKKFRIFRTIAVQNFEDWNFKDYKRPKADPSSGMLPPKVARMMVNLAINGNFGTTLLDPFCGVGTILAEAMLSGFNVIGSDNSPKATEFAKANLEWIEKVYKTSRKHDILLEKAQSISDKLPEHSISAIVTEPYMGFIAETATKEVVGKLIKDLENLYTQSLSNWTKVLCKDGLVVMAFPSFNLNGLEFRVKSPIDMVGELGYTLLQGPITYSRPQAIVKRNIHVLRRI